MASTADAAARAVQNTLERLAPHDVRVGSRQISAHHVATLHPEEMSAVTAAIDTRQAEFASGRALLRELLGRDVTIPAGPNRAPEFPPGVVGSLAHDQDLVIAAVTERADVTAIGIDIEPRTHLDDDESGIIVGPHDHVPDPLTAFVQKEAVYKAWSALGGRMLEHHEVVVRSDDETFTARVEPEGREFAGRHGRAGDVRVALVVALRHEE